MYFIDKFVFDCTMKKNLLFLFYGFFLAACSNSVDPSDGVIGTISIAQEHEETGVNILTSPIVSDPANDPYSVENMSKAMRNRVLAKRVVDTADVEQMSLKPNYLYVRFLADGKRGAAELKKYDTSLVLFKHPLDYKHIRKPVVYIDPTLPDSIIPLFATVPVDYKFGPTKYEVIKELFLVEPLDGDCEEDECVEEADSAATERALLKKAARKSSGTTLEKLADMGISLHEVQWESMSMTGYIGERFKSREHEIGALPAAAWSLFGGGKKHGGQLKFKDDILGVQPLEGVRVTGGYSYYWREAHTDAEGKFKIPEKWNFDIDYEANFDAEDFLLEDGHSDLGEDLEIEKNNMSGDWKQTFYGDTAKWCIVWTAAYQYWYGDNFGLKRPRQNTAYNWSLDIEVYYKNEEDYYDENPEDTWGNYEYTVSLEDISVMAFNLPSYIIYGTTIHEIAHSSHYWNMKTTNSLLPQSAEMALLDSNYKDTYARGIENYFIDKRYNKKIKGDKTEYRRRDYNFQYTGLVEDLMGTYNDSPCRQKDVYGFSIINIETAFFQNKTFSGMKSYLKKNNTSGKNGVSYTSSALDKIFKCWGIK